MAGKIIDGKKIADAMLEAAKLRVAKLSKKPCLAIVIAGDDPASLVYTKKKHDACARVGIESRNVKLPASASEKEIISEVKKLNSDRGVDGILVQLPLPDGIDEDAVLSSVALEKDVDGFHAENFGRLALGIGKIAPCTPKGVMHLLKESGVSVSGKNAVVIGKSRIVGKPLALLLLNEGATVTVCHSKTRDLATHTRGADIICSAVGKPRLVTADMVKEGAVVIDIGTSKENEKLIGDVDFEKVKEKAALITPVPGGVGPMTIAMLIENTLICHQNRK
ncbi:MAG: bifunctional 5,10-methylenetetrahydrofolate dehydrogenase/5,10-methenyltetrahydrofolate cyclohydrolase [Candidatus Micrarchaeota archaeon]|nr:bifunctional 5,10-methylenetetrahydrofolate dehydrogenase/5,10-methenyltetrahydrofolate cyclohydrolase [Candidatus Micrarchaeota archaeon]